MWKTREIHVSGARAATSRLVCARAYGLAAYTPHPGRRQRLDSDVGGNIIITSSLGGISYSRRAITSSATASIEDTLIGVSATSALEIRLPSAADYVNGQYFLIKDEAGNANNYNITIKASGSQTIDGESAIVLESPFASVNLYSNGVSKFFIY